MRTNKELQTTNVINDKIVSPQKSKNKQIINVARIETDLGMMIAVASEKGICMFEFADYKLLDLELRQLSASFNAPLVQGDNPHFNALKEQLEAYFKGERRNFSTFSGVFAVKGRPDFGSFPTFSYLP